MKEMEGFRRKVVQVMGIHVPDSAMNSDSALCTRVATILLPCYLGAPRNLLCFQHPAFRLKFILQYTAIQCPFTSTHFYFFQTNDTSDSIRSIYFVSTLSNILNLSNEIPNDRPTKGALLQDFGECFKLETRLFLGHQPVMHMVPLEGTVRSKVLFIARFREV